LEAAALIFGPHSHHLDHLGPLSQLLNIPLFFTDEELFNQAKTLYPAIDARLHSPLDVATAILKDHRALFSCLSKTLIDELFFFAQHALRKNMTPIWCPHGNSDKGYKSGFMKYLSEERAALIYGPKMLEFFKTCGALEKLCAYVITGNYRLNDYRIHQTFYDRLSRDHVHRKLPPSERTLLFAPTWQDSEASSSFNDACEILIKNLPLRTNLIIKLHPNTLLQEERLVEQLQDKYSGHSHVLFLNHYPHIYSLLALCDVYIGDASSMGYDFLSFDRPMVFLNQQQRDRNTDPGAYLFRCGIVLLPKDYPRTYTLIEELLPFDHPLFSPIRKEVYEYTFGEKKMPETLRSDVASMLQTLISE
jgi:teichoic acid glycerol-phosphate primase